MVGSFLGVRVAGECQGSGLQVDFEGFVRDVGSGYCEEDVISLGV